MPQKLQSNSKSTLDLLPNFSKQIDSILEERVSRFDKKISKPALRLMKGGGKRLRSKLLLASTVDQSINLDLLNTAAAIELAHLATLVHDDIIDNSDMRRGTATINGFEGVTIAILVGDCLLTESLALAAEVDRDIAHRLALVLSDISEGQLLEFNDRFNTERSIDSYMKVVRRKTANLISLSCELGALLTRSQSEVLDIAECGKKFGISFQIFDDLLDFVPDSQDSGKHFYNDLKEGVYTLPVLLGLKDSAKSELQDLLRDQAKPQPITDILKREEVFKTAFREAEKYYNEALLILSSIDTEDDFSPLRETFESYHRKMDEKISSLV